MAWFPAGAPEAGAVGVNAWGGLGSGVKPGVIAVDRPVPRANGAAADPLGVDGCAGSGSPRPVDSRPVAGAVFDSSACTNGMTASCPLITTLRIDTLIRFKLFSF